MQQPSDLHGRCKIVNRIKFLRLVPQRDINHKVCEDVNRPTIFYSGLAKQVDRHKGDYVKGKASAISPELKSDKTEE